MTARTMGARLEKLERGSDGDRETPEWWAIRKWLGETLTAEQEVAVAEYDATRPPYDPLAPVDTREWPREDREWFGFRGPAQECHVRSN